ncbi:MAG: toxin-antitoxin system YwqK family antitoxin [Flavobacteriales bacterium]|nr:toxin-antitoxin system YwqK family antitoxin [Flavobacteriales bacterium]NCG29145.1 hypothetical protein [Bacteroidota bacterium]MBT3963192.1 toxin-antitoxin system YwqK family antitoxin [Flavobacteriales bacterium]MBT4705842.1 toxin-antitoxin system YwqK family antitoxin [Flavobacteriales bacterium]MBT4931594.1 toxin-antitoxin system YwqK family antitoxin [Flavobacteriales bacterium]
MKNPFQMKNLLLIALLFCASALLAQNAKNDAGRKVGYLVVKGADSPKPGYSPDDKIEEGEYQEGRKTGKWKGYFASGKLKNEITYINGRPKGPYTTFFENGKVEEKGTWSLNKNQGKFTRYYPNGQVQQDFTFNESGKRDGDQTYYHENGQVMIEGNWAGGKENGEVKEYFANGEVKSVRVFNGGQMDASKSTFKKPSTPQAAPKAEPEPVASGNQKVKASVAVAQTGAKANVGFFDGNGDHTLYNKNKQISQKGEFNGGRLWNGKFYKYDDNGILTNIEIYKNGRYVGEGVIDKNMQ